MTELLSLAEVCGAECPADDAVALRDGRALRRAEFLAKVWAWRDMLAERDGRHWALYFRDSYEFACALFGAWHAGKTVFLPSDERPGTLDRLRSEVDGFIGEFAMKEVVTAPDPISSGLSSTVLEPEAVVLVVFTSGTTGDPLAIPKTVRQLDREVRALHSRWGVEAARAPVLASVPHQHMYGLPFKVLWPLCRKAAFSCESVSYPEEVADRLTRFPGVWITSPAILKRLPADLPLADAHPHVRLVFSAGSPLPFEAAQRCAALLGRPIVEIYGSSETGAVAWRVQTEPQAPWRPLPEVSVARCSERGVLTVRSPWLATTDEWRTADRGEVYGDGSFCLLGRVDRILKIEDKRVSLAALELALETSPLVWEARVIGLADGRLAAAVILRQEGKEMLRQAGKSAVVEQLRGWLRPHVEEVTIPRRWRFLDSFPQNLMGKVADATLRDLFSRPDSRRREPQVLHHTRGEREVELRIFIPADLLCFDGHFLQAPILPGVIQVDWAVAFARRFFEVPKHFRRLEMLKFQRVIIPRMTVTLLLENLGASQTVAFRYLSDAGQHSCGRIAFGD